MKITTSFSVLPASGKFQLKPRFGKLSIKGTYESVIDDVNDNFIQILPINFSHTVEQNRLPLHHRDPFDRIIVSQTIVENMNLISADAIFDDYLKGMPIQRIW